MRGLGRWKAIGRLSERGDERREYDDGGTHYLLFDSLLVRIREADPEKTSGVGYGEEKEVRWPGNASVAKITDRWIGLENAVRMQGWV